MSNNPPVTSTDDTSDNHGTIPKISPTADDGISISSVDTSETRPHRFSSITDSTSRPSSTTTSTSKPEKTYIEKYAATVTGCGYVRLSCQIIDRYLLYERYSAPIPTKAMVDKKYLKMLDKMVEKQVHEIISGAYSDAKFHLRGLMKAKDHAMVEKNSDLARRVWSEFQGEVSRAVSAVRTVSTSSVGSMVSSISGEQTQETGGNYGGHTARPILRTPKNSENLFVPRTRKSSMKKSPLEMVQENNEQEES